MRRLSLRHLRCFATIARTGSFTVAATRLFQTQSSLTATMQQFEEAVGLKLFDRTTRRVVLTEDGENFLPVAERLLNDFDNAIADLQSISQGQRGHVRIAAVPSMILHVLTPALASFRKSYPDITLSVRDSGSHKIEEVVLNGEADFGLTSRLNNYPELNYVPILSDPFGVVFPPDHPLARAGGAIRWADLAGYDHVTMTSDTGIGSFLEAQMEPRGLISKASPHDMVSSTTSLYAMLSMGGKIAILPALAAQSEPLQHFQFCVLEAPVMRREICLITRQFRSFSANTQRILDALSDTLRQATFLPGVESLID